MLETKTPIKNDLKLERTKFQAILETPSDTQVKSSRNERSRMILYILILVLIVFAFVQVLNLQRKYEKEISVLNENILAISKSRSNFQKALKNVVRQRRQYKVSLSKERARAEALRTQVSELINFGSLNKRRIEAMDYSLANLRAENSRLQGEIGEFYKERTSLQNQLASFQKIQDNLQKKINRFLTRTKVELGAVVVKPSALSGKILKANRKYNFVIIDLGRNDGVRDGTNLIAYRQDNLIGGIRIEKVYDELSVGKATFDWTGDELGIGDTVKGKD